MKRLSIVVGFRDRDLARVKRSLDSLAAQSCMDFEVLFVDYGSAPDIAAATRTLVSRYDFCRYVYSCTTGRPWNRSHAINTGIKLAVCEYVMTSDIDIVFSRDFIRDALSSASRNKVLYALYYYLPQGFDRWDRIGEEVDQYVKGCKDAQGFITVSRHVLCELGGYDEHYRFWGLEDQDLHDRLLAYGLTEEWMTLETSPLYHQWHPITNNRTPNFMPAGYWDGIQLYFQGNQGVLRRNAKGWGHLVAREERSALTYVENADEHCDCVIEYPTPGISREHFIRNMKKAFDSLSSSQCMMIRNVERIRHSARVMRQTDRINRLLGRMKIRYGIHPERNAFRDILFVFSQWEVDRIADWYFSEASTNEFALLIKK